MPNAGLNYVQINQVKNYKKSRKNRFLHKNSLTKNTNDLKSSSEDLDYQAYSSEEEKLKIESQVTQENIKKENMLTDIQDPDLHIKVVTLTDLKNYRQID